VTETVPSDTGPQTDPKEARIEIATAALLSLAGLISAWASYQASLWGGQQADHYADANAMTTEATRLSVIDGQAIATDTLMFLEWLEAAADGDERRMTFFQLRFSPEMQISFNHWRARVPADPRDAKINPGAPILAPRPLHPEGVEARRLQAEAARKFAQGDVANGNSDRFVAGATVLSIVLFIGGISPLLKDNRVRIGLLALAALIGAGASIFIFSLPAASL